MPNTLAYGFANLQDIFDENVTNVRIETLDEAVRTSAQIHSEDLNALLATFVERTTTPQIRYELPGGGELQAVGENGTPLPTRAGARYTRGFPLFRGADSFGANREAWQKMTVGGLNRRMLNVQTKDARWNIRRILAAMFTNVDYVFDDEDDEIGAITVGTLAKTGDGSIYPNLKGELTSFNHYVGQANAISDTENPYKEAAGLLRQHPSNLEPFVAYVSTSLIEDTMALSAFYLARGLEPLVNFGADVSTADDGVEEFVGFGKRVVGVANNVILVEAPRVPDGWIITYASGSGAPLRMREEPEAGLQGLQPVIHQVDSNFRRYDFYRKAGYGVANPVSVVVTQVGSATYSIPSGFDIRTLPG